MNRKVLDAQAALDERKERCSREVRQSLVAVTPPDGWLFDIDDGVDFIRSATRKPSVMVETALVRQGEVPEDDRYTSQRLAARRMSDGKIAWDVDRVVHAGDEPPGWFRVPRVRAYGNFIAHRCPCTPRDLVAIDALLEAGDKRVERLAKACRRGGLPLEGARRRTRRR